MPPYTNIPLSPAELSYLHASLSQDPPIRPDGRSPTQFRPLVAECDFLPTANGSARICFADGVEAVVGVKAEVEGTGSRRRGGAAAAGAVGDDDNGEDADDDDDDADGSGGGGGHQRGEEGWVEISIEIPGMRDDDALPVFLAAMLTEALLADAHSLTDRLYINSRFHWRLYVDILLLSQPLSYPLPLLSLTTHLALLSTRLPALVSQGDEDPLFNDDWEASLPLFPRSTSDGGGGGSTTRASSTPAKPPITLLVMTVGPNILFDPSKEELAVADSVLAVSARQTGGENNNAKDGAGADGGQLQLVALRTIDPPSRLTARGMPHLASTNTSTTGNRSMGKGTPGLPSSPSPSTPAEIEPEMETLAWRENDAGATVWRPPRGGVSRALISRIIHAVVGKGGVGREVMDGLAGVGM